MCKRRTFQPNNLPNDLPTIQQINQPTPCVQVRRLSMDDAPVPYASSMEKAVVKRGEDLVAAVIDLAKNA